MDKEWNNLLIQCPFYVRNDRKNSIICEGITDTSRVILRFSKQPEMLQQLKIFCCGRYGNCELYRAVMEKYE